MSYMNFPYVMPINFLQILPNQGLPNDLLSTRLRRRIECELVEIGEVLAASSLHDEITESLRHWHRQFRLGMRHDDVQTVVNEFIALLQELLRDPIFQAPLDEGARLGSDGKTYGLMSLTCFLSAIPIQYRHRQPLDLDNETPFTTVPHPIAKHMVKWLENCGCLLHSLEIENLYRDLTAQGIRPVIPTPETERVRFIRARHLRREAERGPERNQLAQELVRLGNANEQEIRRRFADIQLQLAENARANAVRFDEIQENEAERNQRRLERVEAFRGDLAEINNQNRVAIQEGFEVIRATAEVNAQQNLTRVDDIGCNDQAILEAFGRVVDQTTHQIEHIERQNAELTRMTQSVDIKITEAQKEDAKLKIAINETKKAIKERNKGWVKGLAITLGTIAVGCAASMVFQTMLSSTLTGSQVSLAATEGVPTINFSFIL